MEFLAQILSYPFARRAIIAGLLLSVSAALLGVNLVLKRFSMLGDGLSHVSFGAAAIGLAAGVAPLQFSIPIVIIAAFLLLRIRQNSKINGDAAIAIVSSSALAVGITVATLTTGMNTDINSYMFGSILALTKSDVIITALCGSIIIAIYVLFYQKIFAISFDEDFAAVTGVKYKWYNSITAILTAVTVVIGMRIMGALLISSIITFPALSSMRICKHYKCTVIAAAIISVVAFLLGLTLSFLFDLPAGAAVVLCNLAVFLILSVVGKIKKI
ncbi:MAG: metal ABC transporter permease [Clostridia bacterium]|nr:metal ABC transporter permease [Clostridia bacterium]